MQPLAQHGRISVSHFLRIVRCNDGPYARREPNSAGFSAIRGLAVKKNRADDWVLPQLGDAA